MRPTLSLVTPCKARWSLGELPDGGIWGVPNYNWSTPRACVSLPKGSVCLKFLLLHTVQLESSNKVFPKLWCKYKSPGTLLKCRFWLIGSKMGPKILHFYRTPWWCCCFWSMDHILWLVRLPLLQASSRTSFPNVNPFSSSSVLWNLGAQPQNLVVILVLR